ncbi:MAG TPA: bacteriohemerythrin [Magnetospirillum sp.]|jgi:hemerythrin-like metal-binding protein|nr:bacteriohemerythrin [Magnetospirillum sp.]
MTVNRIEWTDEYKLGIPVIDREHRELLDVCNEFLDAVQHGEPIPRLAAILDRMLLLTRAHFVGEERMLDRHGYPGLAAHKAEHDHLLVQAEALKARYLDVSQEEELRHLTMETADFLQTWLLDHIRTNDRPYRPFLMSLY